MSASSITKSTKETTKGTKEHWLTNNMNERKNRRTVCAFRGHPCQQCTNQSTDSFSFLCFFVGVEGEAVLLAGQIRHTRDGPFWPHSRAIRQICRWHGRCELRQRTFDCSRKGKLTMKTVVSVVLGAVMLFGASTLGLPSGSASAKDKHDKNYWRHHRRHHRHHRGHRKNHLSY